MFGVTFLQRTLYGCKCNTVYSNNIPILEQRSENVRITSLLLITEARVGGNRAGARQEDTQQCESPPAPRWVVPHTTVGGMVESLMFRD